MSSVHIIGDSRLTEYESFIRDENTNNLPIFVEAQRGARLNQLGTLAINRLHNTKNTSVIIAGGINNCTFKDIQSGKYYFNFQSEVEMTSHLMAEFNSVDNLIRSIHGNVRVAYCDIIGMDMEVYKYCTNPTPRQQDIFDSAIIETNRQIVNLNKKNQIFTPWIAKTVHLPRKHGFKHAYERLVDGLHWDDDLKVSCAVRLVNAATKLLQ